MTEPKNLNTARKSEVMNDRKIRLNGEKILLMFILGEGVKKHRKTKRSLKFSHPIDSIRKFEGGGGFNSYIKI